MSELVNTIEKPIQYSSKDKEFWKIIITLGFASILTFANLYMVQPLLPLFVEDFNITPTKASLSLSLSVVAMIAGLLFFGFLSDRRGRVLVMKITLVLSIAPLVIIPLATSFKVLLVLRVIQGFFVAGLPAAAIAYIGEECEQRSVSLGITIYIACNAVGGMGGRVLIGVLSDTISWQMATYVLFVIGLLICIAFFFAIPKSKHFKPSNLAISEDILGMLVHLKNPLLIPAFVMGIILQLSFTGLWTYLPFHLQAEPFHLSIKEVSLTYLAYTLGVVGSPIAGKLAATFKQPTIILAGILTLVVGSVMTASHSLLFIVIGLCLLCLGFFIAHSIVAALVNMRATHHKGGASSLYLVSYYIGVALGGTVSGYVWLVFGWFGLTLVALLLLPVGFWLTRIKN